MVPLRDDGPVGASMLDSGVLVGDGVSVSLSVAVLDNSVVEIYVGVAEVRVGVKYVELLLKPVLDVTFGGPEYWLVVLNMDVVLSIGLVTWLGAMVVEVLLQDMVAVVRIAEVVLREVVGVVKLPVGVALVVRFVRGGAVVVRMIVVLTVVPPVPVGPGFVVELLIGKGGELVVAMILVLTVVPPVPDGGSGELVVTFPEGEAVVVRMMVLLTVVPPVPDGSGTDVELLIGYGADELGG